jgi:thioredoxin 1
MVEHLNENNFKSSLSNLDLAAVDFWAEWCAPCRAISPVLEEFEKKVGGNLKLFKVDIDKNPSLASEYGVESIPTILIFKKGMPVDSLAVGLTSKREIEEKLKSAIKTNGKNYINKK